MTSQKDIVTNFLQIASRGQVDAAYEAYVAANFVHHNVHFPSDRQSLLNAMKDAHHRSPNKSFEIKQVLAEGDRVMTFSHVVKEDMQIAVVHIARVSNGKIVELWDTGQVLGTNCPNELGPF